LSSCHLVDKDVEFYYYLNILRRRWPLVAAVPLLAALVSLAAALLQPPRFGVTARLLVTRPDITVDGEDTLAYDLPAIVGSKPFAADVAAELARRGRPLDEALVERALHAENQRHVVFLSATAGDPADAAAIAQAAVALVQANGLRYWGDTRATPERPGINIAVLDLPATATRLNGPRAIAMDVGLRALLGLMVGVAAAFALHYLAVGWMAKETRLCN
jgi:capsular polysaccharide biosynthesis protein